MFSRKRSINITMKLCAVLFLVLTPAVSADGHADICSTQFNWWFNTADNLGPEDYPKQTAEEKLMMLIEEARQNFGRSESELPTPSVCKMQQNANEFYDYWEAQLRVINGLSPGAYAPGFGFPFHDSSLQTNMQYHGLSPLCDVDNSILQQHVKKNANNGGPAASCAFGYPGSKTSVPINDDGDELDASKFNNVRGTCRLKIFGYEEQDLELQWCITDILNTMVVGEAAGYYDGEGSKTPALSCPLGPTFSDANPVSGTSINPPYAGAAYPTTQLDPEIPLGSNPGGKTLFWTAFSSTDRDQTDFTKTNDTHQQFPQGSPNDPYQAFAILFRQLADQKVAGLCNECEECVYEIHHKYKHTAYDSRDFCIRAGLCEKSERPKSPKKQTKKTSSMSIRN